MLSKLEKLGLVAVLKEMEQEYEELYFKHTQNARMGEQSSEYRMGQYAEASYNLGASTAVAKIIAKIQSLT